MAQKYKKTGNRGLFGPNTITHLYIFSQASAGRVETAGNMTMSQRNFP